MERERERMLSRIQLFVTPRTLQPSRPLRAWNSPGKNTRVGCHCLLQGIFPSQGWNPGLPHCRQAPYHLSHQGSHINPMPSLTKAHFFSFSTTTPRGEPVFIQCPHLHSAQLHTSPLNLTSTPVLSGPPVTSQLACSVDTFQKPCYCRSGSFNIMHHSLLREKLFHLHLPPSYLP